MFFGKPDRHGSGYRKALFADNFAVLSYCCRKACCGRRFARCGHDEKVYGDDLRDLSLRVALAAVLSKTALGTTGIWLAWPIGWTIATALSLIFYGTADWKKYVKKSEKSIPVEAENDEAELEMQTE